MSDDYDEGSKSENSEIGDSSCTYKRLRMQTLPRKLHPCSSIEIKSEGK